MNRCKNKNTTFWKLNRRKNDMAVVNFFSLSLPLSLSPSLPLLPDSLSSLSPSLPLSSLTPSPPSLPLLPDSLSPSLPLSLSPSLPPSLKHPSHLTSFPLTSSSLPLSTPFPPSLCLRLYGDAVAASTRGQHGKAKPLGVDDCQNFSKVSALVRSLHKVTV